MGFNVLKIKALILQKGISQEKLCSEINVTKQTLINYFNGRTKIDAETLYTIANFLSVPVNYFYDDESTTPIVNEPPTEYKRKPKYLEQRLEELEERVKKLETLINQNK